MTLGFRHLGPRSIRHPRPSRSAAGLLSTAVACTLIAACGSTTSSANGGSHPSVTVTVTATSRGMTGPVGCTKVGVLLPNTSDPRWQHQDGPLLTSMITKQLPGANVTVDNAGGSSATQLSQATADLSAGDCILVVSPVNRADAATIVTQAMARKVPVVAYDQPIQSKDTSYVVAFDQVKVGELQGQYIDDHFRDYAVGSVGKTALINGDVSAIESTQRHQGTVGVLQPLFDNRNLQKVYDQFTPGDNPATAETEVSGVLTITQDNIQIVYTADDGLADGAIQALQTTRLKGKVLVTGAGATVAGLRHILTGDQAMTVEMNPRLEAQGTAGLVSALAAGTSTTALVNGSVPITGGTVPAVLETPVAVDKTNINQTVITDGSVTLGQLCTGLPAGTGGICP